jgi:hypothetical protein
MVLPPRPPEDSAAGAPADASARPRRQSDLITAQEIAEVRAATAYNAVELLRPTFLRSSNPRFPVVVYVNGSKRGGIEELRRLRPEDIESIRRLSASTRRRATARTCSAASSRSPPGPGAADPRS